MVVPELKEVAMHEYLVELDEHIWVVWELSDDDVADLRQVGCKCYRIE